MTRTYKMWYNKVAIYIIIYHYCFSIFNLPRSAAALLLEDPYPFGCAIFLHLRHWKIFTIPKNVAKSHKKMRRKIYDKTNVKTYDPATLSHVNKKRHRLCCLVILNALHLRIPTTASIQIRARKRISYCCFKQNTKTSWGYMIINPHTAAIRAWSWRNKK